MEVNIGVTVLDKERKVLGTIDHVVRDTWSGEQKKFIVRRKAPEEDLLLSPTDIAEVTDGEVKLNKDEGSLPTT